MAKPLAPALTAVRDTLRIAAALGHGGNEGFTDQFGEFLGGGPTLGRRGRIQNGRLVPLSGSLLALADLLILDLRHLDVHHIAGFQEGLKPALLLQLLRLCGQPLEESEIFLRRHPPIENKAPDRAVGHLPHESRHMGAPVSWTCPSTKALVPRQRTGASGALPATARGTA